MEVGTQPISIYLVDDQAMIRAAFEALLNSEDRFRVVGSSGEGREALAGIAAEQPDVVLLDLTMPGLSGFDMVGPIRESSPRTKILIASNHEGSQHVRQALDAGAQGYVSKDAEGDELRRAIEAVHRGESFLSSRVAEALTNLHGRSDAAVSPMLSRLTPREREVFQLLAIGRANKEVAEVLGLSLGTVKKHRENLQRKLDCRSSAELARLAIREGLLDA